MRKVTEQCAVALNYNREMKMSNTQVFKHEDGYWVMSLHRNWIVKKANDGSIWISNAGWFTPTTKERLNGFLDVIGSDCAIYQKKGNWYIKGLQEQPVQWNGDWIQVTA